MQCSRPPRTFRIHARRLLPAPFSPEDIFGNDHPSGDRPRLRRWLLPHRNGPSTTRSATSSVWNACSAGCAVSASASTSWGLTNVKVLRLESQYTLGVSASSSIRPHAFTCSARIPWPKARHHKRRLVQQEFLAHPAKDVLNPGRRVPVQNRPPRILRVGAGAGGGI